MKISFYSSAYGEKIDADWPCVPREGEFIRMSFRDGPKAQVVKRVGYLAGFTGEYFSAHVLLGDADEADMRFDSLIQGN